MSKIGTGIVVVALIALVWWVIVNTGSEQARTSRNIDSQQSESVMSKNGTDDKRVENKNSDKFGAGTVLTVYKSPTCGCCDKYEDILKENGFEIEVIKTQNMSQIKAEHGIPSAKQSCHTIVMGDYFIEGHVPMKALEKLLSEKPDVDGIGLSGMPAGSPGMPGVKRAPFEVYQAKDGSFGEFMRI